MARMDRRTALLASVTPFLPGAVHAAAGGAAPTELSDLFRTWVDRQLVVPQDELPLYQRLAEAALAGAQADLSESQYLLVVDRSEGVQAALLFWRSGEGLYRLVGATPVSTGRPGTFDHFETPQGAFEHTPANPDFRAEGTYNRQGIRGYGAKGLRVYDFGWQTVPKGWGDGAALEMRLQMHATDPDALERRLGSVQSKGCIRIPATFNRFLDHYGVLDAEYEQLAGTGRKLAVLKADREPVADAGRYLVVVDSGRLERPAWSPAPAGAGLPRKPRRRKAAASWGRTPASFGA